MLVLGCLSCGHDSAFWRCVTNVQAYHDDKPTPRLAGARPLLAAALFPPGSERDARHSLAPGQQPQQERQLEGPATINSTLPGVGTQTATQPDPASAPAAISTSGAAAAAAAALAVALSDRLSTIASEEGGDASEEATQQAHARDSSSVTADGNVKERGMVVQRGRDAALMRGAVSHPSGHSQGRDVEGGQCTSEAAAACTEQHLRSHR